MREGGGEERERERKRKTTHLLVPELNQPRLVHDDLVTLVLARLEQLREREPLPGHLIPIIGVHELIVVHAVGRVALDTLHRRLAAVQRNDIVDQALAGGRQRQALARVRRVVLVRVRLSGLEVLARGRSGDGPRRDGAGAGGHFAGDEWDELLLSVKEAMGWGKETGAEHAKGWGVQKEIILFWNSWGKYQDSDFQ